MGLTRGRLAGVGLILLGLVGVVFAVFTIFDAWSESRAWTTSPEAEQVAEQLAAPTPVWIAPATPEPSAARVEPLPTAAPMATTPMPVSQRSEPPRRAPVEMLALESADFRFLDPPEPGARAKVAIRVANTADAPSDRIVLGIAADWFSRYSIIGSVPAVSEDRTDDDGLRMFSFPPLPAGETASYELHVAPLGEEIRPPTVQALLADGEQIGEVKTVTHAPPPRPGPVMSIEIPSLKLKSGVVQTAWEAPPFIVGQIKDSAHVTLGNTVLVGHVSGRAGNVFGRLEDVKPGEKVTAMSRGLPYEFVVSRIIRSTNIDATPMQASEDGKLTLMTCAGVFNPITQDYSERLWVIAEAPDKAVETIAQVSATATVEARIAAAATATAFAAIPTPTPYTGEPSLAGGLGNTREDLGKVFGAPLGETLRRLVVFRQSDREYHVRFTPDPPRSSMLVVVPMAGQRPSFDAAVRDSRRFFPSDARPSAVEPEGNDEFVVERFESPTLEVALDSLEFSVVYIRDRQGLISHMILGLGSDVDALIDAASQT